MEPRILMWLELMKYYGLTEVEGTLSNKIILDWFKELGFDWVTDDSETAWCSLAVNIMAKRCGVEYSGKLNARSWLRMGKSIIFPQVGDITVFYREKITSWKGHVGLFAGYNEDKTVIYTLGGNQNNKICIAGYPKESDDYGLLCFRELKFKI